MKISIRDIMICNEIFFGNVTYKEVAKKREISTERCRQIVHKNVRRLHYINRNEIGITGKYSAAYIIGNCTYSRLFNDALANGQIAIIEEQK